MENCRPWLQRFIYDLSRIAVRVVGRLFCRLHFLGQEHFPPAGPALVCSNHQSYLDPMLLGGMCDRRLNYLARENLFHSKFFGRLIRYYDAIPVRREGMSIAGLKETLRRLRRNEMVVIFPEGTRSENGEIQALKPGFCVLARRAKVPLVPVAIAGAFDSWPKGVKFPRPHRICMAAGEPIDADQIASLNDEQLVELLETRIRDCFQRAQQYNVGPRGGGRQDLKEEAVT